MTEMSKLLDVSIKRINLETLPIPCVMEVYEWQKTVENNRPKFELTVVLPNARNEIVCGRVSLIAGNRTHFASKEFILVYFGRCECRVVDDCSSSSSSRYHYQFRIVDNLDLIRLYRTDLKTFAHALRQLSLTLLRSFLTTETCSDLANNTTVLVTRLSKLSLIRENDVCFVSYRYMSRSGIPVFGDMLLPPNVSPTVAIGDVLVIKHLNNDSVPEAIRIDCLQAAKIFSRMFGSLCARTAN